MNLTQESAIELLNRLGVKGVVLADKDDEVDIDELVSQAQESYVTAQMPVIEQQLTDRLTSSMQKTFGDLERKNVAKAFGLNKKELEGKTFEEMLAMGKEHLQSQNQFDDTKWNEQIEQLTNEIETWETKYNTDIAAKESEWKQKYEMRDVQSGILSLMQKMQRTGGDAQEQANSYLANAKARGLDLKPLEDGKLEFYKDGKIHLVDNKRIDINKDMTEWAKKVGIYAEDTSHVTPSTVTRNTTYTAPKQTNGHPLAGWAALAGKES